MKNWPAPNPEGRYDLPPPVPGEPIPGTLESEIARLTPQETRDTFDYFGHLDTYSLVARTSLRNMSLLRAISAELDGNRKEMLAHKKNADDMTQLLQPVDLTFRDLTALEREMQ